MLRCVDAGDKLNVLVSQRSLTENTSNEVALLRSSRFRLSRHHLRRVRGLASGDAAVKGGDDIHRGRYNLGCGAGRCVPLRRQSSMTRFRRCDTVA
jgi:hypothetical protein